MKEELKTAALNFFAAEAGRHLELMKQEGYSSYIESKHGLYFSVANTTEEKAMVEVLVRMHLIVKAHDLYHDFSYDLTEQGVELFESLRQLLAV